MVSIHMFIFPFVQTDSAGSEEPLRDGALWRHLPVQCGREGQVVVPARDALPPQEVHRLLRQAQRGRLRVQGIISSSTSSNCMY